MAYHRVEDGPWPVGTQVAVWPAAAVTGGIPQGSPVYAAVASANGVAEFGGLVEGGTYTAFGHGGTQTFTATNQEARLAALEGGAVSVYEQPTTPAEPVGVGALWIDTDDPIPAGDTAELADDVAALQTGLSPHRLAGGEEPAAVVVWSADDGYTAQVPYFNLLNARGIKGTLFLTPGFVDLAGTNPTWSDTYITKAQVQAIANAGHELGTHGGEFHVDYIAYLNTYGQAAFLDMLADSKAYIETNFGVTVTTGAYPGGQSTTRVRELTARNHEFYRGTKSVIARNAQDPFDVMAVDCQALSEAAIKGYIDQAVAERCMVCFLVHGGMTAGDQTKYGNAMDYATGLGVPQKRFDEAMFERTQLRVSAATIDAQGNTYAPVSRTHRLEVFRNDMSAEYFTIDIDEATSAPYVSAGINIPIEFRIPARFTAPDSPVLIRTTLNGEGLMFEQNSGGTITAIAKIYNFGRIWHALGDGGNMKIDSGAGGSFVDINAWSIRFNDHTGALKAEILSGKAGGAIRCGSGATGARPDPATAGAGASWYDTTLGKPIFSNGTAWRDAAGTAA